MQKNFTNKRTERSNPGIESQKSQILFLILRIGLWNQYQFLSTNIHLLLSSPLIGFGFEFGFGFALCSKLFGWINRKNRCIFTFSKKMRNKEDIPTYLWEHKILIFLCNFDLVTVYILIIWERH